MRRVARRDRSATRDGDARDQRVAEIDRASGLLAVGRDLSGRGRRHGIEVEDAVGELEGLTPAHLVTLGENGVKTLDDVGDLAGDELKEVLDKGGHQVDLDTCNAIILAARKHWFPEAEQGEAAAPEQSA